MAALTQNCERTSKKKTHPFYEPDKSETFE